MLSEHVLNLINTLICPILMLFRCLLRFCRRNNQIRVDVFIEVFSFAPSLCGVCREREREGWGWGGGGVGGKRRLEFS